MHARGCTRAPVEAGPVARWRPSLTQLPLGLEIDPSSDSAVTTP